MSGIKEVQPIRNITLIFHKQQRYHILIGIHLRLLVNIYI
jgi:hypothetical protein